MSAFAFGWPLRIPIVTAGLGYVARELTPPPRSVIPEDPAERQVRFMFFTSSVLTIGIVIIVLRVRATIAIDQMTTSDDVLARAIAIAAISKDGRRRVAVTAAASRLTTSGISRQSQTSWQSANIAPSG